MISSENLSSSSKSLFFAVLLVLISSCKEAKKEKLAETNSKKEVSIDLQKLINDTESQLKISIPKLIYLPKHPRLIETDSTKWKEVPNGRLVWTSGFYPGILWYAYDVTGNDKWKQEAIERSEVFEDFKTINEHHDIGFMMFLAYGLGYEIGGKKEYKDILLTSANSLASIYNPKVGTIKSWPNKMHPSWQQHITIINNMLNLKILF